MNDGSAGMVAGFPIPQPGLSVVADRHHTSSEIGPLLPTRQFWRGKKTKTFISLQDLPQGPIPGLASLDDDKSRINTGGDRPAPAPAKGRRVRTKKAEKPKTLISLQDLPQGPIPGLASHDESRLDADGDKPAPTKSRRGRPGTAEIADKDWDDAVASGSAEDSLLPQDDVHRYPPVIQQARHNMNKFENSVLLTRVGAFYELYFENAEQYGPLLNIKVAQKRTNAGPVAMAGFPFFQLERFLKILVQDLSCSVAIAEEFRNDPDARVRAGGLMNDRRVSRIITPGTLIDENFIDPFASNYVLSIHFDSSSSPSPTSPDTTTASSASTSSPDSKAETTPSDPLVGLAWMDISTGQFYTQTAHMSFLPSVLSRVGPREVVLDQMLESHDGHELVSLLAEDRHLVAYSTRGDFTTPSDWSPMLESEVPESALKAFTPEEIEAGNLLLHYGKERLQGLSMKLQPPKRYENMDIMGIDKNTMRALEIKQTMKDGAFRGSLLHAVRRTGTKGGARLLNEWLCAPSTSLDIITSRQDLVEHFLHDQSLRVTITALLKQTHDSQRLVQKFALGRGDPDDLIALGRTIFLTEEIVTTLRHANEVIIARAAEEAEKEAAEEAAAQETRAARDEDHREPTPSCQPSRTTISTSLNQLITRLSLTGPLKLAHRIRSAVDEEGIEETHQLEDESASSLLSLAEEVVTTHGSDTDATAVLPKRSPANPAGKTNTGGTTSARRKRTVSSHSTGTSGGGIGGAATGGGLIQPPTSLREYYGEDTQPWIMKPAASAALTRLHAQIQALTAEKEALTQTLREQFGAPTLTLKWTPQLGHICHVKGAKDARAIMAAAAAAAITTTSSNTSDGDSETTSPPEATETSIPNIISSSRSTRSFHLPSWTALGLKHDQTRTRIRAEETRVFTTLRKAVIHNLILLRRNAAALDELDVAAGFALLAKDQDLVRPILRSEASAGHNIVGGRHPTVEGGLSQSGRSFVRNDCFVGSRNGQQQHGKVWLITGPNMAGKSTFLRQNALITILAQAGCFVPASFAEIGIVDAIFSRVGSGDNLYHDQSTFMVEMLETAAILRASTPRSFVIMDEVGRGTSPDDGAAVAFACLNHLATVNRCRSLFATHFHNIADHVCDAKLDLASGGPVDMHCTDVQDDGAGGFVYIHRLRKGVNRDSHALKVASLAGLPERAIAMARDVILNRNSRKAASSQAQVTQ